MDGQREVVQVGIYIFDPPVLWQQLDWMEPQGQRVKVDAGGVANPKSVVGVASLDSSTGGRQRCQRLSSLREEYHVVSAIDGFLALGLVQHAEPHFNQYRREGHQFEVGLYNKLLFGWAEKNNRIRATLLLGSMKADGVEPNFSTYAAMLVLCGRTKDWEMAEKMIKEIEQKGYNIKHILHQGELSRSQCLSILEVLNQFNIQFERPTHTPLLYPRVVRGLYDCNEAATKNDAPNQSTLPNPPLRGLDTNVLQKNVKRQFDIELQGHENVPSIIKPKNSDGKKGLVDIADIKLEWKKALSEALQKDAEESKYILEAIEAGTLLPRSIPRYFPFMGLLSPEEWADILIEEIVVKVMEQPEGLPVSYVGTVLKDFVWNKCVIKQLEARGAISKSWSMYQQYLDYLVSENSSKLMAREFWNELSGSLALQGSLQFDIRSWPTTVQTLIAGTLLQRLIETAKIPANLSHPNGKTIPAFYHVYQFEEFKKTGYITAHPHVIKMVRRHFTRSESSHFRMSATILPMLIPPKPWTSVANGGYFVSPGSIVRCYSDSYQHQLLLEQAENLGAVYDALNYVGSCPWRVNTKILDLAVDIFNGGGNDELQIPSVKEIPLEEPLEPPSGKEEAAAMVQWAIKVREKRKERRVLQKIHRESYSLWMDMLYKLSLANHYRNDVFWLPHNLDFRGRAYPVPPHVTHLSSDVGRALLKFGVGYPLGKKGLDWLKIHIINLHGGLKKAPLQKRLEHANEMLPAILESADRPMDGKQWWQTSDDPWQALACCMEIASAIRSGSPEDFVSYIPVHQDGSCNGPQHYAALGRDTWGARQVNLLPQERPEDLYAAVASLVEEKRRRDAVNGHHEASVLEGKIHRKVVKQTVMTVVYGVTRVGGRLQIAKQLHGTIPDKELFSCANYVVGCVFESLREMFTNARQIQDWLTESARKIGRAGKPVEWVTPLGLPVVQPYHKRSTVKVKTSLQQIQLVNHCDISHPPDVMKQKNAIPPNFVHSLDSTHMMLTALHCQRAGVTFVAVHDSYWTHACSVDLMNKLCREQFVALHSEPLLSDLGELFEAKFGGLKYKDKENDIQTCSFMDTLPSTGDLELREVLQSTYFFS
ncbi:hypothetical protein EMCRGX_G020417 [Ephydatia muelleri]